MKEPGRPPPISLEAGSRPLALDVDVHRLPWSGDRARRSSRPRRRRRVRGWRGGGARGLPLHLLCGALSSDEHRLPRGELPVGSC